MDDRRDDEMPAERGSRLPDWLVGLLTVETIAVAIALVMPVTPSRTGSTWSPAQLYWPEPTYVQKAFASFVMGNVILAALGVVVWLLVRRDRLAQRTRGGGEQDG